MPVGSLDWVPRPLNFCGLIKSVDDATASSRVLTWQLPLLLRLPLASHCYATSLVAAHCSELNREDLSVASATADAALSRDPLTRLRGDPPQVHLGCGITLPETKVKSHLRDVPACSILLRPRESSLRAWL